MKNRLIKTICIFSSIGVTSLVSCGQNKTSTYRTEIGEPFFNQVLDLVNTKQLKNKELWERFVQVYKNQEDTAADKKGYSTWRCEFWGKMMRGATLCYRYSQDEELYNILTETVKDLLTVQDDKGRFSSYSVDKEFTNWDMWGRKYVMTAMLHYYEICKDGALKNQIITALKKHADYIISKVGNGPNQKNIIDCGSSADNVKGLNASTILEPFVNLYEVTKDNKYLNFAKYIIDAGGCQTGNMMDALRDDQKLPHEYPIHKAYETLSFFEGVYRYARATNDSALINQTIRFFEKVYNNEITVIGGAGNHEEDFNHGVITQTIPHNPEEKGNRFGIETCVTVTWMRVLNILYENTHDIVYYNRFAKTAMNAFLGAVNLYNQKTNVDDKDIKVFEGLPFDSYSPLCNDSRGKGMGGTSVFKEPTPVPIYGCCVCIAPASVGLIGINYSRYMDNKLYLNEYYSANIYKDGTNIEINGDYLKNGKAEIVITSTSNDELLLRIPEWANEPKITVNGEQKKVQVNAYYSVGKLKDIKNLKVEFNPSLKRFTINDKVYFTYGPYTLAVEELSNQGAGDLSAIFLSQIPLDNFQQVECISDEFVHFKVLYNGHDLHLINYSSAGRKQYAPNGEHSRLTVFFN